MKKKKLLRLLISYYKCGIEFVKINPDLSVPKIKQFLCIYNLEAGVCCVAEQVFGEDVYGKKWIKRYLPKTSSGWKYSYWGDSPLNCSTYTDIIAALQLRVDNMQKELNRMSKK